MSGAPRTGVLGRDPKPDDEGRFPRPTKERAECVEKRACTKERYKALRSIGSGGIRSHGYVTSSNTTPQTALVTPPIIWGPTCSFFKNAQLSSNVTKG